MAAASSSRPATANSAAAGPPTTCRRQARSEGPTAQKRRVGERRPAPRIRGDLMPGSLDPP
eukprot:3324644-Lingulodinium_polyedra.AAC.1